MSMCNFGMPGQFENFCNVLTETTLGRKTSKFQIRTVYGEREQYFPGGCGQNLNPPRQVLFSVLNPSNFEKFTLFQSPELANQRTSKYTFDIALDGTGYKTHDAHLQFVSLVWIQTSQTINLSSSHNALQLLPCIFISKCKNKINNKLIADKFCTYLYII